MTGAEHWEKIYATRSVNEVGWYAAHLKTSTKWVAELNLTPEDPIIDVGGGASSLVDDLLISGHRNLTVLDLSETALALTRERTGTLSRWVSWLQGDVNQIRLPSQHFDLWHDRAVFHFLIDPEQQQKYKEALLEAVKADGHFIIGAFGFDAPPQCSGLPVQRYTSDLLRNIFGPEFELMRHQNEIHTTPSGIGQAYVYCLFKRRRATQLDRRVGSPL